MTLEVLRDVSLEVRRGELIAITGESGSGKTVLLNIVGLLDVPTEGRYEFAGRNVAGLDDDQRTILRNRMVGFVFQNAFMLPRLTARENVAVPLVYRHVPTKAALKQAQQLLERVGLADFGGHKPHQLSGGQLQRVAIARALVGQPEIILADEPCAALDDHSAEEVLSLLFDLNREDGGTVILVTHDIASAAQCQRRYSLENGVLMPVEETAVVG